MIGDHKLDEAVQRSSHVREILLDVGRKYARSFEQDNLRFTDSLLNLGGCRKMMVWLYCLLRNIGKLTPLEELPQEEKEHMWEFVKEICVGEHRQREKMREMMMVFYTLEYFLNEQK